MAEDLIGQDPTKVDELGLSYRERMFVEDYSARRHPTRSAVMAGYPKEAAAEITTVLLFKPHVKKAIEIISAQRERRIAVTVENVVREYARIAFFDPRMLFDEQGSPIPIHELDDATAAALAGFEVDEIEVNGAITQRKYKYKLSTKLPALEALGKSLGLFIERLEVTGKDGVPLLPDMSDNEKARRIAFMLANALRESDAGRLVDILPD